MSDINGNCKRCGKPNPITDYCLECERLKNTAPGNFAINENMRMGTEQKFDAWLKDRMAFLESENAKLQDKCIEYLADLKELGEKYSKLKAKSSWQSAEKLPEEEGRYVLRSWFDGDWTVSAFTYNLESCLKTIRMYKYNGFKEKEIEYFKLPPVEEKDE